MTTTTAPKKRKAPPRKAVKPPASIRHDLDAPPAVQAAHIALIIERKLDVDNWRGVHKWIAMHGDPRSKVILSEHQQQLLDTYAHLLPYVSRRPKHVVIACPVCGRYGVSTSASSAKCTYTLGCEGKLVSSKMTEARRSAH